MDVQWTCNQHVVNTEKLWGIKPMDLSDPWYNSYLNNCNVPQNFDNKTLYIKRL